MVYRYRLIPCDVFLLVYMREISIFVGKNMRMDYSLRTYAKFPEKVKLLGKKC